MRPFPWPMGPQPHASPELSRKPIVDRRSRRSSSASVAAGHYLERVLERCALEAIVVGSLERVESPAVVASARAQSAHAEASELARVGAEVIRGNANAGLDDVDVFAHTLVIGDTPCVLVTAGSRVDRLKTIAADLSRILA